MSEKNQVTNNRPVPTQDSKPLINSERTSGGYRVVNENYRNYSEVDRDAPPPPPSDK